jgi:hypothetical protein
LFSARQVRFGSQADMSGAKRHVRFTPNSDRESGLPRQASGHVQRTRPVCFGPKADIAARC